MAAPADDQYLFIAKIPIMIRWENRRMSTAVQSEMGVNVIRPDCHEDVSFLVAYAKIVEDKDDGVYMQDVYFGGMASDHEEADRLARECVNTAKGGTILPKIIEIKGRAQVLEGMRMAAKRFNQIELQMFQAEDILARSHQRHKPRKTMR